MWYIRNVLVIDFCSNEAYLFQITQVKLMNLIFAMAVQKPAINLYKQMILNIYKFCKLYHKEKENYIII